VSDVVANGVRFNVQRLHPSTDPPRATVVLIHGLLIDNLSSFFYTLGGPLVERGFSAVMYDLRGHGRSDRPVEGYSIMDALDDLTGLLDAMEIDQQVILVGNSYGGTLASWFAVRHPGRVAGLILIEAHTGDRAAEWIEEMANTLTVAALGLEHDRIQDQLATIGQRKLALYTRAADRLLNHTTLIDDLAGDPPFDAGCLAQIDCPVLAVYGQNSELAPAADDMEKHLKQGTVVRIPELAHTVLTEATGRLTAAVTAWLEGHF
jgi:pimeloyl-ACP methyl ester carboxylesterase